MGLPFRFFMAPLPDPGRVIEGILSQSEEPPPWSYTLEQPRGSSLNSGLVVSGQAQATAWMQALWLGAHHWHAR